MLRGWASSGNITRKLWTCIVSPEVSGRNSVVKPREIRFLFSLFWVRIVVSRVNRSEIWNFYNSNFSSWSRRPVRPLSSSRQVSFGKRDFELVSPEDAQGPARLSPPPLQYFRLGEQPARSHFPGHSSEKFNFLHVVRKNRYIPWKSPA